jgi:hypothetical protein
VVQGVQGGQQFISHQLHGVWDRALPQADFGDFPLEFVSSKQARSQDAASGVTESWMGGQGYPAGTLSEAFACMMTVLIAGRL